MKEFLLKPANQAFVIVGLMVALLIVLRVLSKPVAAWNSTVIVILIFCLWNAVAGVFVVGIGLYLLISGGLLLLLFIVSYLLSPLVSGVSYEEFGSDATIYLAPVIYYPIFLLIMGVVRLFVSK